MMNSAPKVFICHASEDKERFVMDFAEKLREKGVDAWLDKWEIKVGDSLIDRIFEEGIKECKVFIIILSEKSINKKWVKEELNSGTIQRIERNTKVIPVIIDENIEVPMSLRHIVWEKINDLNNYKKEFDHILNSIYDISEKPPLGKKPKYSTFENKIKGLSNADSIVLKVIGDIVYNNDDCTRFVENKEVFEKCQQYELSYEIIADSFSILVSDNYIKESGEMTEIDMTVSWMTVHGFLKYCEYFLTGFEKKFKSIVSLILNENLKVNNEISEKSGCKLVLVDSLLENFEEEQFIRISNEMGISIEIFEVLPKGKRYFNSVLQ